MRLIWFTCILCLSILVSASEMGMFLRTDGELLTPKTALRPHFSEVYLLPAAYSGFTNQRLSFYVAAYYSLVYNITMVLPEWVFDYNYIHFAKLRSFDYFYSIDEDRINKDNSIRHFKYSKSLPPQLLPACLAQLQTMSTDFYFIPEPQLLQQYALNHGVICLHADGTFYGLAYAIQNETKSHFLVDYPLTPMVQSLRSMLVVSDLYERITASFLSRLKERYGHTDYLSVHVRNEPDFVLACSMWTKRSWGHDNPNMLRACLQDDTVIYSMITSPMISIPLNNSILLIMNSDSEDLTFANMSTLCHHRCDGPDAGDRCYVFHCIRKESLISSAELLQTFPDLVNTPTSLAMIDDQLAQHGILFFGNMYSTMSVEIYHERRLGRTPYTESVFYNRYCSSYSRTNVSECP